MLPQGGKLLFIWETSRETKVLHLLAHLGFPRSLPNEEQYAALRKHKREQSLYRRHARSARMRHPLKNSTSMVVSQVRTDVSIRRERTRNTRASTERIVPTQFKELGSGIRFELAIYCF